MSDTGSGLSRAKIDKILQKMGARTDNINIEKVTFMDRVTVGND
jgi:uncharacterized protein YpuA (DUF1002 family)